MTLMNHYRQSMERALSLGSQYNLAPVSKADAMSSISTQYIREFNRLNAMLESAGMRSFDDQEQQTARGVAAKVLIDQFLENAKRG
ncbi:hypothetical protein [Agrobacterium pusense]|uniref:hypothetical protein n=1 Tax=Agrobacterium pusense TaxID=648995 RepID=UPI001113F57E|nr:hypothetical protein [Agrobacterium pusense]WKD47971.1 hypothetical protein M8C82_23740 [Agrobacterium pusense]